MLNILKKFTATEPKLEPDYSVWKLRDKIDKWNYLALKANIKGHAAMGRALREEANRSRGLIRQNLREMKKGSVAWQQRLNLLALGVLKGRHYRDVEPVSLEDPKFLRSEVSKKLSMIGYWGYTKEHLEQDLKRFFDDVD
jgi:hypothetical protein